VLAGPADADCVLPGHPRIRHAASCPIYLAALELLGDDLDWFHDHPGAGFRLRPVTRCEFAEMATAVGRRVPRSQRRHWITLVTRYRSGVNRAYAYGGRVVSIQVVLPDPAGAT